MSDNAAFFDKHVPRRLQRALVKSVFENYKGTSRYCFRHFGTPQAKDLSGVYRRAKIEDEFAGIEALFPDTKVVCYPYQNNTGYYNEVTCGWVKLTQSCIIEKDEVPRFAQFRAVLARNGQLSLFESQEIPDDAYRYAILTHGVDVNSPKRSWPAFIIIQFPNESCSEYLDEGIDLMGRFPEVVSEYIPKPEFGALVTKRRRKKEQRA